MFGDSVRDMMIILINIIVAILVVSLGIGGLQSLQRYGTKLTVNRVQQEVIQNSYEFNGIDGKELSRDECVALVLSHIARTEFEMSLRVADNETRTAIEADDRIFTRAKYLSNTAKYDIDFYKSKFLTGKTYKAYLVYKGVDTTTVKEQKTNVLKGDYITGIAFVQVN